MTTILISVAIIAILLAFTFGRWSKSIDINRQLHDIKIEGVALAGIDDVCRVISRLDYQKSFLTSELNQLRNSNNAYQKNIEQLKADYYKVMSQLREKRDELSKMHDQFDSVSEEKCRYYHKLQNNKTHFEEFISQLWDKSVEIANETKGVFDSISDFIPMQGNSSIGIYATKLKNKTELLSIGFIKIADNGTIIYSDNSRSLGLLTSNVNKWAQNLHIPDDLKIGEPYLLCAIYTNDINERMGRIQSNILDINGDALNMQLHINDNKNLLNS